MRSILLLSVAVSFLPAGCALSSSGQPTADRPSAALAALRYVALGDSYTIGTSVSQAERFPNQLVERLRGTAGLELVANLGANGYTSANLIAHELPELDQLRPDFVTLLIGVNDVVQRVSEESYRANVVQILSTLLAQLPRERIVVVSTPDYTRTPRGSDFGNPVAQREQIARFNEIMATEARERGIAFVDIGPVADQAETDESLVASDLLHPSGVQYGRWVDLIAPVVTVLLGGESAP